jgi:hypothetical protein
LECCEPEAPAVPAAAIGGSEHGRSPLGFDGSEATVKINLRVLRLEALERRLRVAERAVHAEVFQAHQPSLLRLRYELAEEQLGDVVLHQPRPRFLENVMWSKRKSWW